MKIAFRNEKGINIFSNGENTEEFAPSSYPIVMAKKHFFCKERNDNIRFGMLGKKNRMVSKKLKN